MIQKIIAFSLVVVLLTSCSQKENVLSDSRNDSIQKYLELAGNDSLDVKLRDNYNVKALALVDLERNDTLTRFYLSRISFNYMKTKNKTLLYKIGKLYFKKSSEAKDTLNLARYYRYKVGYLKNTFVYDSSFYYYLRAEKFYKKTDDELGLATVYINEGIVQYNAFDFLGSEITLYKACTVFKKIKNSKGVCETLNQLGLVSIELGDFDKAFEQFNDALEIIKEIDDKNLEQEKIIINSNLGFLSVRKGDLKSAIKKYEETLQLKNVEKYPSVYSNTIDNIVTIKMDFGNYNNVLEPLMKVLVIRKQINDPSTIFLSYLNLSRYYRHIGNTKIAEKYAFKALNTVQKTGNKLDYLNTLNHLADIDKKYIPIYFEEYIKINEDFQISERKARNNFARIAYETDEITQEKDKAISQKWLITGIASTVILIVVLILIITRQRARQKQLQLLQEQQKANEEIYQLMLTQKTKEDAARQSEKTRIARELHDGVMNKLASTRLSLSVLAHNTEKATIAKCLTHINDISKVEADIRSISHDLSHEVFQKEDSFIKMLEDFIYEQNQTSKTHYVLETDVALDWSLVSSEIKMNLYRTFQEASHNINKYAKAKKAIVNFVFDDPNLCMSIIDDGVGFDTSTDTKGIGIQNMKTRVKSLGGKFKINSTKGNTSINIAIPLQ